MSAYYYPPSPEQYSPYPYHYDREEYFCDYCSPSRSSPSYYNRHLDRYPDIPFPFASPTHITMCFGFGIERFGIGERRRRRIMIPGTELDEEKYIYRERDEEEILRSRPVSRDSRYPNPRDSTASYLAPRESYHHRRHHHHHNHHHHQHHREHREHREYYERDRCRNEFPPNSSGLNIVDGGGYRSSEPVVVYERASRARYDS